MPQHRPPLEPGRAMSILYDLSVPGYIRGLKQVSHLLKLGQKWANENKCRHDAFLGASLAPDMKPIPFQVWSATNTAKAVGSRLAGLEEVFMEDHEVTLSDLQNRIDATVAILQALKPQDLEGKGTEEVVLHFSRTLTYATGIEYLQVYGIPNFWFHVTTIYAILRSQGVPLTKQDFIG